MFVLEMSAKSDQIFVNSLITWFKVNKREFPWRNEKNPYNILIAEKFLQQTTYGHVLRVYEKFLSRFPDIYALSKSNESEISVIIQPLGFQNQRAKQLFDMSKKIIDNYDGKIPSDINELVKLPGVGKYISSAVACFAFNQDQPIIDVNVRRVVKRYFSWNKFGDNEIFYRLEKILPKGKAKEFNWGIIDFSNLICGRKPKCEKCFLTNYCRYFKTLKY